MRPVEYFLSHESHDRPGVVDLEGAMRRRGIGSWRDRKNLLVGDGSDAMIRAAIESETAGFVLYGTERIGESDYVWEREWPWAHERHAHEAAAMQPAPYRLVPLLVDEIARQTLTTAASSHGQPDPMIFNGARLARGDASCRDGVARYLLRAGLADRMTIPGGPLRIRLTTFAGADDDTDLLVDWSPEFGSADVDWPVLLSALRDIKDEVARSHQSVEVDAQARLIPAFVFGHAFPLASRIPLVAITREGAWWARGSRADLSLVRVAYETLAGGDPTVAVVEVSLARDVGVAASAAAHGLRLNAGRVVRLQLNDSIETVDPGVAAAAAFSFGRALRAIRDDGIRESHIFIAAPAPMALLLGASVSAGPAMTLYYTTDGEYRPSLRLPTS
jgi:hypothetical protein